MLAITKIWAPVAPLTCISLHYLCGFGNNVTVSLSTTAPLSEPSPLDYKLWFYTTEENQYLQYGPILLYHT